MEKRVERVLVITALVLAALVLGSVLLDLFNISGAVVFSRGTPNSNFANSAFSSGGTIADLYTQYSQIIDFFLFLMFFIAISQMVFGEKYPHKGLFISIGTFLSLSLVLWESRTGVNLLELSGPFPAIFIAIAVLVLLYKLVAGIGGGGGIGTIACFYIVLYLTVLVMFNSYAFSFFDSFYYWLPFDLFGLSTILFFFAILICAYTMFTKVKGGKN